MVDVKEHFRRNYPKTLTLWEQPTFDEEGRRTEGMYVVVDQISENKFVVDYGDERGSRGQWEFDNIQDAYKKYIQMRKIYKG